MPISGLAIGAMSPDFEYLFRLAVYSRLGHTALGLIVFSIPLAFVTWLVFVRVIRPALVELLPPGLARAMRPPERALLLGLAAVAVGAISHVVWDGVTHRRGWTPTLLPMLLTEVAPGLPLYRFLQHSSSVIGAIAIAVWAGRWLRRQPAAARAFAPGQRARSLRIAGTLLTVAVIGGLANMVRIPVRTVSDRLALFAVGGMAAFAVALLVLGVVRWVRPARRRADGATISACPD